jgi:hypothetical protein
MTSGGPDDREPSDLCGVCGSSLSAETQSAYSFGTAGVLCFECSIARGGRFDADRDTWDPPPDIAGLPDEAYGAAPHERRHKDDRR